MRLVVVLLDSTARFSPSVAAPLMDRGLGPLLMALARDGTVTQAGPTRYVLVQVGSQIPGAGCTRVVADTSDIDFFLETARSSPSSGGGGWPLGAAQSLLTARDIAAAHEETWRGSKKLCILLTASPFAGKWLFIFFFSQKLL